jgi:RHS repeat-associated protein
VERSEFQYKYNGKEFQDELGLNVTAMDFRQYDSAIGRFLGMDRLSELAYSITPYRFAYNNPVYWSDPTGLFETKAEAKEWAKKEGIRTGWFSRNKIEKGEDGSWAVNNRKEHTSYSAVNSTDAEAMVGVNAGDVIGSALVVGGSKKKEGDSLDFTIYGTVKDGDTRGRKGTPTHSLESSDFITPGSSRSLNNKTTGMWEWILSLFNNASSTSQHGRAIQEAVTKNGNTSTMEVQNTEPVAPQAIEVTVKVFALDTISLSGKYLVTSHKDVTAASQKQIDSLHDVNAKFKSDYNLWLNHVNSLKK